MFGPLRARTDPARTPILHSGQLEPGGKAGALLDLVHFLTRYAIGAIARVVERRRHQILEHLLFFGLHQAVVDRNADDPALALSSWWATLLFHCPSSLDLSLMASLCSV